MAVEQRIDVISPAYVGEEKITLSLDPRSLARVGQPVTLRVDYAAADRSGGVGVPLVFTVQPEFGDGSEYIQQVFTSTRPSTVTIALSRPGSYLLTLRESARNHWIGRLRLSVEGESSVAENAAEGREFVPRSFLGDSPPLVPVSAVVANAVLVYADAAIVVAD